MLDNDFFRVACLVVILIAPLFFKKLRTDTLNKFIFLFIGVSLLGESAPLIFKGYNLLYLSVLGLIQLIIISCLIYYETSKKTIPLVVSIGGILFFLLLYFTDWSSNVYFLGGINSSSGYPILLHQFFDLYSVINLGLIVLVFTWLYHIVYREEIRILEIRRRYIFIFSFLIYAGGTFFMVAFGRIILPSFKEWYPLWSAIFYPIWLVFYLLLFFGILWRQIRS